MLPRGALTIQEQLLLLLMTNGRKGVGGIRAGGREAGFVIVTQLWNSSIPRVLQTTQLSLCPPFSQKLYSSRTSKNEYQSNKIIRFSLQKN